MLTKEDFTQIRLIVSEEIEKKLEEKLDVKLEEKLEAKLEEKLEAKLEEKLEAKLEEKLEAKLEEKLEQKFEIKLAPINQKLDRLSARLEETITLQNRMLLSHGKRLNGVELRVQNLEDKVERQSNDLH